MEGLLWRDYYRFMLKKFTNCYFKSSEQREDDAQAIESFVDGKTEDSEINSLIDRLNNEGMITRAEREYLALYFIHELKQPWLTGAAFFEKQLVDYAPATIYGFWSHIAGEGTSLKNNKSDADWLRIKKTKEQEV